MSQLKRLADEMVAVHQQYEDDLKTCHEYYCRYNCGTTLPVGNHTDRCNRLRLLWGFQKWDPVKEQDRKTSR